jgi:hypothetical protein
VSNATTTTIARSLPAACRAAVLLSAVLTIAVGCRPSSPAPAAAVKKISGTVEASCGQCQMGLEGGGCDVAVRIEGTAYYVDGVGIDDHGNAHATDGFCNAVRQARVTGELVDGRFVAESFVLLPASGE